MDEYMEGDLCDQSHPAGDIHSGQYLTIPYYSAEHLK